MSSAIFWPVVAQVGLVAIVSGRLFFVRSSEIRAKRLRTQTFATSATAAGAFENVATADNFKNQFEVPVLFYAVCCALAVTSNVTPAQLALAWVFVSFRALHCVIHLTYNRVRHRFYAYVMSTFSVFAMWLLFALALARS